MRTFSVVLGVALATPAWADDGPRPAGAVVVGTLAGQLVGTGLGVGIGAGLGLGSCELSGSWECYNLFVGAFVFGFVGHGLGSMAGASLVHTGITGRRGGDVLGWTALGAGIGHLGLIGAAFGTSRAGRAGRTTLWVVGGLHAVAMPIVGALYGVHRARGAPPVVAAPWVEPGGGGVAITARF